MKHRQLKTRLWEETSTEKGKKLKRLQESEKSEPTRTKERLKCMNVETETACTHVYIPQDDHEQPQ
jgi:hypothetical protein